MQHRPVKRLGQNFLRSNEIIEQIVEKSEILLTTSVIEIGPGLGALTEKLIPSCNELIAIELDKKLIENLQTKFLEPKTRIIQDDFLKTDLKTLIEMFQNKDDIVIVANIPYYITSPIIFKVLAEPKIKKMVLMVQKEVGVRLNAKPGTKEYNGFSVLVQTFASVKKLIDVKRKHFTPIPKVDSMVIEIKPFVNHLNFHAFSNFLKIMFQAKRKTLKNNLITRYPIALLEKMSDELLVDLTLRAETLERELIVEMFEYLEKNNK
jgi:16S rRNA (adenine1518-N6/adenine1519-N6)-dimethyltransferase